MNVIVENKIQNNRLNDKQQEHMMSYVSSRNDDWWKLNVARVLPDA